ncbi:MAG: hypothetical protein JXR37_22615 [Kiritimatiellae bacterium]|nr:hypothetical protein [Kiritimatiellia bacterium]
MVEPRQSVSEIKDSDIVFRCPYCTKSLVIDRKAAGLSVRCTDCGKTIQVPGGERPPERREAKDPYARVRELERSVETARGKIRRYEAELGEVHARRVHLEKEHAADLRTFEAIARNLETIKQALQNITEALDKRE